MATENLTGTSLKTEDTMGMIFLILGFLSSIAIFLIPMIKVVGIVKDHRRSDEAVMPYINSTVSITAWVVYSVVVGQNWSVLLNLFGLVLHIFYIYVFFKFRRQPSQYQLKESDLALYPMIFIGVVMVCLKFASITQSDSWYCVLFPLVMFRSCHSFLTAIKLRESKTPLGVRLLTAFNGAVMFGSALCVADIFTMVPSALAVGVFVFVLHLLEHHYMCSEISKLFFYFNLKKKKIKSQRIAGRHVSVGPAKKKKSALREAFLMPALIYLVGQCVKSLSWRTLRA